MNYSLLWNNVVAYSLQIGLLVGLAAFVPALLRLKMPLAKLGFWHLLLAACLLLPLVQPWRQEAVTQVTIVSSSIVTVAPTALVGTPGYFVQRVSVTAAEPWALLSASDGWRLGFWRLGRYRRYSRPLVPAPSWSVEADLRISEASRKPGHVRITEARDSSPRAISRSGRRHARRDSVPRSAARAAARLGLHGGGGTGARRFLVSSGHLVAARRDSTRPRASRGSRRHRGDAIARPLRGCAACNRGRAGCISILHCARCFCASDTGGAVLHRGSIPYPDSARAKHVQGVVTVEATLDSSGNVVDTRVLNGPIELRRAAQQSVLNWHFAMDTSMNTRTVKVTFELPAQSATSQLPQDPAVRAQRLGLAFAGRQARRPHFHWQPERSKPQRPDVTPADSCRRYPRRRFARESPGGSQSVR